MEKRLKNKIVEKLKYHSFNIYDATDNRYTVVEDEDFESIAEEIVKLFSIPDVSQRSELLAFAKEMQDIGFNEMDDAEKVVDIYIKANCG